MNANRLAAFRRQFEGELVLPGDPDKTSRARCGAG